MTIDELIQQAYPTPMVVDDFDIYVFGGEDKNRMVFNVITSDKELQDVIRQALLKYNGVEQSITFDKDFYVNGLYVAYGNQNLLRVRGWGYLIGIGGLHLDEDTAIKVQDTFLKQFVEKVNK